ncbi:rhodanese-like domain-containing protein [Wenzhouxiangella sp. XN24]|uniref:rhodanese-like domain-containing protein n=1 Tax=Wenzhouxiangella sp. XN24 TaxID=2713569 RepID=UPI001980FAD2|nr:rhodanese-like domain-containing protein [Wenzhouxiangella sp. XN24]
MTKEMTPAEFVARAADEPAPLLLDVREEWELAIAAVEGATHMPMDEVPERFGELAQDRDIVVLCRSGVRSAQVARFLEQRGFDRVWNLAGGILEWSARIDPSIPPY